MKSVISGCAILLFALTAFSVESPFLNWNAPGLQKQIKNSAVLEQRDGQSVLTFQLEKTGRKTITIPVEKAGLLGKTACFSVESAQENVSLKPKSWNGVKVMWIVTGADGKKYYPQASNVAGSRKWTKVEVSSDIPDDAKDISVQLGLENVSGTVHFRSPKISVLRRQDYSSYSLTGWTDRPDATYKPGEPMKFFFRILKDGKPAEGSIRILRSGDDGTRFTHVYPASSEKPLEITASLRKPGYVMVQATLLTPRGEPVRRKIRNKPMREVRYGLAGGVDVEKLRQGVPEPSDFDAFWKRTKSELKAVPLKAERKLFKSTEKFQIYDVSVTAPGPRPARGYLAIPRNAGKKSLPLEICFDGYAVHAIEPRTAPGKIVFFVNAHGIENQRESAYYEALSRGTLANYGFRNNENENPETCYFKYMILRDLRALEYARTLPEWDGKNLYISGGSQGAFQAVAVTALTSGANRCTIHIPWFCDLGGISVGRTRGWRPDWKKGLGYYDTVNFAGRITCPVQITAGLSDWVCPPSGVRILYNNLKSSKKLTMFQGLDHAVYFGYDPKRTPKTVVTH